MSTPKTPHPTLTHPSPDEVSLANLGEGTILVRVRGLGTMMSVMPLAEMAGSLIKAGIRRFCVDLAECRGMDSTFMGTLVGVAQMTHDVEGWVCLLNASADHVQLLELVGADRYFLREQNTEIGRGLEPEPLPTPDVSPQRRLELVRRAHENLVRINPKNEAQFGAMLRTLKEELDRRASESGFYDPPDVQTEDEDE